MPTEPHSDLLPSLHDVPEGSEIRDSHSIPVIGQTTRNGGADRLRHGAIALIPSNRDSPKRPDHFSTGSNWFFAYFSSHASIPLFQSRYKNHKCAFPSAKFSKKSQNFKIVFTSSKPPRSSRLPKIRVAHGLTDKWLKWPPVGVQIWNMYTTSGDPTRALQTGLDQCCLCRIAQPNRKTKKQKFSKFSIFDLLDHHCKAGIANITEFTPPRNFLKIVSKSIAIFAFPLCQWRDKGRPLLLHNLQKWPQNSTKNLPNRSNYTR